MALVAIRRPASVLPGRWASRTLQATVSARRNFTSYLVTPKELHEALKKNAPSSISTDPRVIPMCASWFMPNDGRTGIETFTECRIPKARFFDIDKAIDKRSPYPHMLPNGKRFAGTMSELGIRKEDIVVVYDSKELGIFSAPRAAWTLKVFGHPKVHILNNFKLWVDQGLPTESGHLYSVECCPYPIPELVESKVASFEDVKEVALDYQKDGAEGVQILDARSPGRFTGEAPEPREGLSSGHMPGAINMPFNVLLDPETKTFRSSEELKKVFEEKGVDPTKPIISSCGTGVTACIIDAALDVSQYGSPNAHRVYDGSWTEWAQRTQQTEGYLIRKTKLH